MRQIQKKYTRSTRQAGQEVDRSILKLFVIISNINYDIIKFFCCKLPFLKLMKTLEILFLCALRWEVEGAAAGGSRAPNLTEPSDIQINAECGQKRNCAPEPLF